MKRHFTVTGFVVEPGRTLLHWHQKNQIWLPPGGHIEPDEDPVQAVIREVREETGLDAAIISAAPMPFAAPAQLPPPLIILVEDIPAHGGEPAHQHIDMIYALRPLASPASIAATTGFIWVSDDQLRRAEPLPVASCGVDIAAPEDVRHLALRAIALTTA